MDYHGNTNYSVVDIDLIDDLYRQSYQEKVLGTERLRFLNVSRLTGVKETPDEVRATVTSLVTGEETGLDADVVVFATGYSPADPLGLLGEVADRCLRDDEGRVRVERDYRIATDPDLRCGIYLQGGTEHTHGITSSLLSNTAIRVGEILDSLLGRGSGARRRGRPDTRRRHRQRRPLALRRSIGRTAPHSPPQSPTAQGITYVDMGTTAQLSAPRPGARHRPVGDGWWVWASSWRSL